MIESHIEDQKHVKIYKANWELATKTDKEKTIGYHPELYTRNIIVSAAASKNWQGQNGHSCDSSTAI